MTSRSTHPSHKTQFKAAKLLAALAIAGLAHQGIAAAPAPNALPTGGQVVAGTATIATTGNTMNVNQTSQRAVVNWSSFDVGSQAKVNFNQPNAAAATLNYVNSASKSMINGAVNANGQVIFVNNNGIVFGKGAEVNVGGMVATTMNTSAADFMAGKDIQVYEGGNTGKVINKGNITGNNINSYIALMAPQVKNTGVITATLGGNNAIALVSGQKVTLKFSGSQFVNVSVDASVVNSLISNKLLINAGSGQVIIAANAAQNLMGSIVRNTGVVSASDISTAGGKVTLIADTIEQNGVIEANSAQNAGGKISLKGNNITLASGSRTSATGATAGGDICIGVNYANDQTADYITNSIQNNNLANEVTVASNSVIDTSAIQNGNGGSINIWSRSRTSVAGSLYARGGAQGGNGGSIETSSKGVVVLNQGLIVDTSSPYSRNSRPGRWVVDPVELIIDGAAAASISNALNTTSVTLDATGSACTLGGCTLSQSPLIKILADIYSGNTATSLSLIATGGQIDINSNITAGSVYAVAQAINVNGSINTNGGSNSNIYLAGAIINILGNINSNGNSSNNSNSSSNTNSSSLNTVNTTTANNRRNGINSNNQNTLNADGNNYLSNGGLINILATGDITISPNSYISANGQNGGTVNIVSTAGKVNINGVVDSLGKTGNAGNIAIAGKAETNLTNSLISSEGLSQGGVVNLGQVNNLGNGTILAPPATAPPAPQALLTFVQDSVATAVSSNSNNSNSITSNSVIIDSQTGINAPNGNIVVFGDQIQVNHSSVTAQNGTIAIGREGYSSGSLSNYASVTNSSLTANKVETSGKTLEVDSNSILANQWLLDPTNVTIGATAGTPSGTNPIIYTNQATVSAADIVTAINAGTSVTVRADGWIIQSSALTFTNNSGTVATFTMDNTLGAKQYIQLVGGITATAGTTNVNIVAMSSGGIIESKGAINIKGIVTFDNTYAVGGSTSRFINADNGLTYAAPSSTTNGAAGTQASIKTTASVNASEINFIGTAGGTNIAGIWADSAITATGDINLRGEVQYSAVPATSGSTTGIYSTNAATKYASSNGTVRLIGVSKSTVYVPGTTTLSPGYQAIGVFAAGTVGTVISGNKIIIDGYGTNPSFTGATLTQKPRGVSLLGANLSINAGADYSAGGTAISITGNTSDVSTQFGVGITAGTIKNNANGGDIIITSNQSIISSATITIAANTTANPSKILMDTTSGTTTGTITNSGAITVTAGSTVPVNLIQKSKGATIADGAGAINVSGYISIDNTNGSLVTPTTAGALGVTITGPMTAGTLAGSTGVTINAIATGTGLGINGTSTITSLAGPVTLTGQSETANAIKLTGAVASAAGFAAVGTSTTAPTVVAVAAITNTAGNISITGNDAGAGANVGISATGAIIENQVGGNVSFISNNKITQTGAVTLVANTGGTAASVLYDTRTGNSGSTIQNGLLSIGAGTSTSAINFTELTNGALIINGGVTVPGYILIDNTNGSSSTATVANINGTTITGALNAGLLAGSNGVKINTVSSGTGVAIQDVAAITALAGPVTLTGIGGTANAINLTATSSISSTAGVSVIGTSSQPYATADTAGAYGAVSVLGAISNTGVGGVLVQSTANTATGAITDSGAGGISITGGYGIAAGTVTGGTITAVGVLTNTGGGVISLSMAQPTSATGGVIEDAAGVTNAVASVATNVADSLRGGVMSAVNSSVNNVNYRSPLTPATISVQLLNSYVTTYGVAFTDAAPQAWIKDAANSAVTISGGGAFGASPTTSSVLGSLTLNSVGGVATIAANRVGGPTTLVTGDILSAYGVVTITAAAAGAGTYTVNPATLTITSRSASSVYDGLTTYSTLTQAGYTVSGLIGAIGGTPTGDAVASTTSAINVGSSTGAVITGTNVATVGAYSVIEGSALGTNLSNYTINYVRSTFNVTPAPLTITAAADSKTYGSTTTNAGIVYSASGVKTASSSGFTVAGLLGSDAVTSTTLTSSLGAIATANASTTPYAITPSAAAGSGLGNYTINYVDGGLTINKAVLTVTNPTMVYNGSTTFATGTSGTTATVTGVGGETFTLGGSATLTNPNVLGGSAINSTTGLTFSGTGSSNYVLPASIANVVITPAPLAVTLAPQTKTYDSTTGAVLTAGTASTNGSYTVSGFVSGQGAYITQTVGAYDSANASLSGITNHATTVSATLAPSDWTAKSGTILSNYSLPTSVSAIGTINKAPLAILANDVSTFVNTQPASGSLTYVVSGLVGTDTPGSAFTVAPAVALASNASLAAPGVFTGQVIPSVTAPNYTVTATPGTLTVLGSNAILVAVGTTSQVYGTYNQTQVAAGNIQADIAALSTPIVTVQYKPAVSGVVNLTVTRNSSTGIWTATDGITPNSASYTFTVTPTIPTASYSTANYLKVGSYALVPANLTLATGSTANCISCTVSYTSGTLTITPAQLLATVTPAAMTYNAGTAITSTTVLSGTVGGVSGVPSGVTGSTTLTAGSPNAGLQTIIDGGTLLSGPDASNFIVTTTVLVPQTSGPANGVVAPSIATTDGSGYQIQIAPAPLVYSGVVRQSVYTSALQTNSGATLTSGTLYSTDNFTISGYASATNVSQGTVADALAATRVGSTIASNYTITYNNGSLTITGAPLIITAASDAKTYGSTTTNSGIVYTAGVKAASTTGFTVGGLIGSDLVSSVTLSSSGALATADVVGSPYSIIPSVAAGTGNLSNYTISYVNGALTVNPAVLTIANASMVYNGTTTFAPGVSGGTTTFSGVNGQTVTLGGSATMTNGNVLGTSAINNTSGLTVVGVSSGAVSNYVLPATIADVNITPAPLTYTGVNTTTVFNNTLQTNSGATLTAGTLFGSDGFTLSGYATKTNVSVVTVNGVRSFTATPDVLVATAAGSTNPNNYAITYVEGGLTITPAPLTATVTPSALTYNGGTAIASTTTLSGFVGGAIVTGATTLTAASPNAGVQAIINGGTVLSGANPDNYAVTNTVIVSTAAGSANGANGVVAVNPLANGSGYTIDIARLVLVYTGQDITHVYTGTAQTSGTASLTTGTIVSGQGFTIGGYASATNVADGKVIDQLVATPATGTLASNYDIRYINGSITITPLQLSVVMTPPSASKVYDSTTAATLTPGTASNPGSFVISGFVAGQGAYITQAAGTYNSANVAGATTITAALTPSVWATTGSTNLSNYALPTAVNANGTITPAPLGISANNAATFVGVSPTNLTYVVNGLVGTDTPASAFTVAPTVSLTSAGTTGLATAGTYTAALVPSVTAPNYTVTPVAGTLTVVGNSILVVSVGTTSQVFGTYNQTQVDNGTVSKAAPNVTVGYCTNCDVVGITPATRNIVSLIVQAPTSGTSSATSLWTAYDSISGSGINGATYAQGKYNFTVTPTVSTSNYSTTGSYLNVGNYALVPGNITTVTGYTTNYQGAPIYTSGNLQITPLTLSFAAATPTQTYNGLTAINSLALTPTNLPQGITGITVAGSGNFNSPNASTAAGYTINNAVISGTDAANFAFAGATGTTGVINKAALVYTGVDRVSVFNGATQVNSGATLTSGTIATGESFTIGGYAQQRNVSAVATPDTLAATAGTNTLASNYTISYINGSLRITPAPLTATVTAGAMTYNGSNAINSTTVLTGFVGGATGATGVTTLTAALPDAGVQTIINGGTLLSGAEAANYSVTNTVLASTASNGVASVTPQVNGSGYTITIAKAPLTYTSSNNTVTFNGAAQTNSGATLTSGAVVAGQGFTLTGYASGTNVTDMPLDNLSAVANAGTNLANYAITFVNGSLSINPAPLTISGLVASNKTYDANTLAVITGTPTLAGQIFAGAPVEITSGAVTQGTFASPSVSRTNPTPVSASWSNFTLSDSNYYIAGPTQPLAARINAVVTAPAPAPAPAPVTPVTTPPVVPTPVTEKAATKPAPEQPNNMVLIASQNVAQLVDQRDEPAAQPNNLIKGEMLYVRDSDNPSAHLHAFPTPSSGSLKFPVPDQTTQDLIEMTGEHISISGTPASFAGHNLLRLPNQSTLQATLEDGSALPPGIIFNTTTRTFSIPKLSDVTLPIGVKLAIKRGGKTLSEKTLVVTK